MNLAPMVGNLDGVFHLMPPWIPWLLGFAVAGLLLWAILARIWPWWKAKIAEREAAKPKAVPLPDLATALGALEKEILASGEYRRGLFELNALFKGRLKATTGLPVTERASPELTAWPGTRDHAAFVARLEALACGTHEPTEKDFTRCLAEARKPGTGATGARP